MSEQPTSSAPTATAAPGGRKAVRVAIGGLIALLLLGVWWLRSTHLANIYATQAKHSTRALYSCFAEPRLTATTPREALLYGPADEKPFAHCRDLYDRARKDALALRGLTLKRDREGAALLASELDGLVGFPFAETARGLFERGIDLEEAFETISDATKLACRASAIENGERAETCIPPPAPLVAARPVPVPRVALEIATTERVRFSAWRASAAKDSLTLAATVREPDASGFVAYVAVSADAGGHFVTRSFDGPGARVAAVEPPALISDDPAKLPRFVLAFQHADDGETRGAVAKRNAAGDALEFLGALPDLPKELPPIRSGSALLELATQKSSQLALVLGAPDPPKKDQTGPTGAILYLGGDNKAVPTPGQRLLSAAATPSARVLVADENGLALYSVPQPGKAWPTPERRALPNATALQAEPLGEQSCGVDNDTYFPVVLDAPSNAALVAIAPQKFYTLPFESIAEAKLDVACGSCPPAILSHAPGGLSLLLPVADKIAPLPVPVPTAFFAPNVFKTARSACSHGRTGIAFISDDRVLYLEGEMGRWQFTRPIVLAEPNENGLPTDVTLVGTRRSLIVLWRRTGEKINGLRIELVSNDGSGWR